MAIDMSTLTLLSEPRARFLFEQVLRDRSVRFEELLNRMKRFGARGASNTRRGPAVAGVETDDNAALREEVKVDLRTLKEARLIKDTGSTVEDFNTYYITADGLEASRKLEL